MGPSWVMGWQQAQPVPLLRTVTLQDRELESLEPLSWVRHPRAFEPGTRLFDRHASTNVRFDETPLESLERLIDPGEIFPRELRRFSHSTHDIFVLDSTEGKLFVPALLLIHQLWVWSPRVAVQLATPGSADLLVESHDASSAIRLGRELFAPSLGAHDLRRAAWIAQCHDARLSWSSVLSNALQGRVNLELPRAMLRGWAWGIEMKPGILVAELHATTLRFDLPSPTTPLLVGDRTIAIPPEPIRRPGFV